jgi:hypothetical protein
MNIENDPAETNRKIVQTLARSLKPKPVQEIADEIQKSYNETLKHLDMIGKQRRIRYYNLPDGTNMVEFITDSQNPKFP